MAPPIGNQNAKKLKTPELRALAYQQYCEHLAQGKDKKCWYFEHPEVTLLWETMEKYIREDPVEFDPIKKKVAEAKGFGYWESVVHDSAVGKNKDANTASLQMVMRNKYQWNSQDARRDGYDENLLAQFNMLMDQITKRQNESS